MDLDELKLIQIRFSKSKNEKNQLHSSLATWSNQNKRKQGIKRHVSLQKKLSPQKNQYTKHNNQSLKIVILGFTASRGTNRKHDARTMSTQKHVYLTIYELDGTLLTHLHNNQQTNSKRHLRSRHKNAQQKIHARIDQQADTKHTTRHRARVTK